MCRDVSINVLILLIFAKYSVAAIYEYVLEDETMFSECSDKPPGYFDINQLFDLSNFSLTFVESGIEVAGSMTTLWDNEPTDIIQAFTSVTYYDRGFWQPTVLHIKYLDFCSIWLDKKSMFYQYTSHILNLEEVKRNCFNVAGTKLIFETFVLTLTYGLDVPLRPGRYRTTLLFTSTDQHGQLRPVPICFEVRGSFEKLKSK